MSIFDFEVLSKKGNLISTGSTYLRFYKDSILIFVLFFLLIFFLTILTMSGSSESIGMLR